MLDLTTVESKLYEIKTVEGDVLQIRKPSQKLFNKIIQVQNMQNDVEAINKFYELFLDILNLNTNGKEFSKEYVEKFDVQIVALVIQDYFEFIGKELGEL